MGKELTEEQADDRDLKELEEGLAEAPETPEREPAQRARREEPEEDDDDPEAYLVEEERQPRRERRASRYDDLQREVQAEREARIRLEAQIAAQQRPAQQGPTLEEFEAQARQELLGLQRERLKLAKYVQSRGEQLTETELEEVMQTEMNLDLRKQEVGLSLAERRRQAYAPPQVDPGLAYLKSRYSDVVNDGLGVAEATAYYNRELRKGRPESLDMVEEAYKYARAAVRGETPPRPGRRPPPTVESRSRYTGQSATGSAASAPPRATVTITKEEAQVAKELYKYEKDPQKRLQRYVSEVKGPSDREAASSRKRA